MSDAAAIVYEISDPTIKTSIHKLVKEALKDPSLNSPKDVTQYLRYRLTPEQLEQILDKILYEAVQNAMGNLRAEIRRRASVPGISKWAQVADDMLSSRVHIGGGIWKQIRDLTLADVETVSADRYRQAKEIHQEGDRYSMLAKAMKRTKVETVGALDSEEIYEILT